MPRARKETTVTIEDPQALRALAHPARQRVLEELYVGEVLTATQAAQLCGLTPSAMSYHLRALEKWGVVTRDEPTGDGRWWNAFLIPHDDRVVICNEQGEIIFAKLSPAGYRELSRGKLIEPTQPIQRRMTVWSHPAFAMRSVFARNDGELIRVNLAEK